MVSPYEITVKRVLIGHRAAVNVVDFDDTYIVSASGDRTIKVSLSVKSCFFMNWLLQFSLELRVRSFNLPNVLFIWRFGTQIPVSLFEL